MNGTSKTGGPAFPVTVGEGRLDCAMSLRDWFAAHAFTGLCTDHANANRPSEWNYDDLAECAYRAADAMLAAREKGTTP